MRTEAAPPHSAARPKTSPSKPATWTVVLRAGVLAIAAMLLARPLTVDLGVAAAALGAVLGAVAGDMMARTRLRLVSAAAIALGLLMIGLGGVHLLASSVVFAEALGPIAALHVLEILRWLILAGGGFAALRLLAARRPLWALGEAMVVAGALVLTLAAHRDGMVHRPHAIGDWAWSHGVDPVLPILLLGGGGVLLLAGLLVREQRKRRLPLHFAGLGLVALLFLLLLRVNGLPSPSAGDLGLTGEPQDADQQQGEGEGGGSQARDELDDLEFRDEYQSNGQQAPVAVVALHDDWTPPSGVYYFRQGVFSQYNGRRLVRATRDDVDLDIVPRFPSRPLEIAEVPPAEGRRPLRTTIGLLVDHIRPFALDSPTRVEPSPNPNPMRIRRAYQTVSQVPTLPYSKMLGRRPGNGDWNDAQWKHYTEAPADPRYGEASDRIIDGILAPEYRRDPLAQALAIKTWLDENGIYSRKSRHAESGDPAASFLFGDLTGYCVHFAHAAAYLYRSRGIPARVASGYAIEESRRGDGSTLVLQGENAHAWPEIYLEGIGWVVVDPAPQQTLEEPVEQPDPQLQQMLGELLRPKPEQDSLEDQNRFAIDWSAVLRGLLWLVAALIGLGWGVKLYRALVPKVASPLKRYRLTYRAALDRLAEIGLRRRFGESRERFAERTAALSPAFDELTREHLRSALGSRRVAPPSRLDELRGAMGRELAGQVPRWRRLVGAARPFTWLRVR